jgi:hypothetical protein
MRGRQVIVGGVIARLHISTSMYQRRLPASAALLTPQLGLGLRD